MLPHIAPLPLPLHNLTGSLLILHFSIRQLTDQFAPQESLRDILHFSPKGSLRDNLQWLGPASRRAQSSGMAHVSHPPELYTTLYKVSS